MEHLAFAWVKFHVPDLFPFLKDIEVCLEGVSIFRGVNYQVDCRIIQMLKDKNRVWQLRGLMHNLAYSITELGQGRKHKQVVILMAAKTKLPPRTTQREKFR